MKSALTLLSFALAGFAATIHAQAPSPPTRTLQFTSPQRMSTVLAGDGQSYMVGERTLMRVPAGGGMSVPVELPPNFPNFSWPSGLAHDADQDILSVVTRGGEGYLYRYDVKAARWLDYRSLNDFDIDAFTYDRANRRYVATIGRETMYVLPSGEAVPTERKVHPGPPRYALGKPVLPLKEPMAKLSKAEPPRTLAERAEIVVVTGYAPPGREIDVVIDRPDRQVVLVLTSSGKILWRVQGTPRTVVKGIVVSSPDGPPVLASVGDTPAFDYQLPYATQADSWNFRLLLRKLNAMWGTTKVDALRGNSNLQPSIVVRELDAANAALTLAGVQPERPRSNRSFRLPTADHQEIGWTLTGPSRPDTPVANTDHRTVVSSSGQTLYRLRNDSLEVVDRASGRVEVASLPPGFPAFSWATGVAHDIHNDVVSVTTLGGEGFFYRYDLKARRWLDHRSLDNIDIGFLAYAEGMRCYIAWTNDGELVFISPDGYVLSRRRITDVLPAFYSAFDRGKGRSLPPALIAAGGEIALLRIVDGQVTHIWNYEVRANRGQLTYKNERFD